jgi:hypothetical protein
VNLLTNGYKPHGFIHIDEKYASNDTGAYMIEHSMDHMDGD